MGMKAVPSLGRSRGELLPIDKGTYVGDTFCMDRTSARKGETYRKKEGGITYRSPEGDGCPCRDVL